MSTFPPRAGILMSAYALLFTYKYSGGKMLLLMSHLDKTCQDFGCSDPVSFAAVIWDVR